MSTDCFQIKGSVLTVIVLELYQYSRSAFAELLQQKVEQASGFFQGSPVIISLEKLTSEDDELDFPELFGSCIEYGLQPIGVRGASEVMEPMVKAMGLAILPPAAKASAEQRSAETEPAATVAEETPASSEESAQSDNQPPVITEPEIVHRPTKVITQPVRAGQQVYAPGADLVVLAQVGETAEVLADGHIHIYGALRGRALAGVKGNQNARIFCQSMEAQLVSVAGNFMLSDDIRKNLWKAPAQAYMSADSLKIQSLR